MMVALIVPEHGDLTNFICFGTMLGMKTIDIRCCQTAFFLVVFFKILFPYTDIDECKDKKACQCPECSCKNTWGSYECTCSGDLLYIMEHDTCISESTFILYESYLYA